MKQLSPIFPGRYETFSEGRFFIPGDLFYAQKIPFEAGTQLLAQNVIKSLIGLTYAVGKVPDINFFINACKYKEAVLTSRMKGSTASLEDVYSSRVTKVNPEKRNDIAEINAYYQALGWAEKRRQTHPLDAELLRQTHALLLQNTRGKDKYPGEFRDGVVYLVAKGHVIHFTPPPASYVPLALDNLVEFMKDRKRYIPIPIKAALIHYQFESIHPFLDGNGRLGRMLFPLYLHAAGFLPNPAALYMSSFFNRHLSVYYSKLHKASQSIEDLVDWVDFCMRGMLDTVVHGIATANKITKLYANLETLIQNKKVPRKDKHLELLQELFMYPIVTVASVQKALGSSRYAATGYIKRFVDWGILVDKDGPQKERRYICTQYLSMLKENSPATGQL